MVLHHCHSADSTGLAPPVGTWRPFYLLMDILESCKSILNAHRLLSSSLLLKLAPLVSCQWRRLLCLNHGRSIGLRSDVSHDGNSKTSTTCRGSCTQAAIRCLAPRWLQGIEYGQRSFGSRARRTMVRKRILTFIF